MVSPESDRSLLWGIPPDLRYPAVLYTIRNLSTLLGRRAVLLSPDDLPSHGNGCVIYATGHHLPDCANSISPDTAFWQSAQTGAYRPPISNVDWNDTIVPVWMTPREGSSPDIIAATFFHLSRLEEFAKTPRDQHGRYQPADSWLVHTGLIERPVVHDYARALGRAIALDQETACPWPGKSRFAVALSHDIDRLRMHGDWPAELLQWKDRLVRGDGLRVISKRLASRRRTQTGAMTDPYETIETIANHHLAHGFSATFYWIAAEPSMHDADYAVGHDDIAKLIRSVGKLGFETGLHGSYDSYLKAETLARERDALSRAALIPIGSTRQHYLRFDAEQTWTAQVEAGFKTDSSLGYSERAGFRAGIAVPFQPWCFSANAPYSIWEVPLVLMDVTLKEYMDLDIEAAIEKSRKIIETLESYGGAASILWHNSSLNDLDWDGWDRVYDDWLGNIRRLDGWGTSVGRMADVWREWEHTLGNGLSSPASITH